MNSTILPAAWRRAWFLLAAALGLTVAWGCRQQSDKRPLDLPISPRTVVKYARGFRIDYYQHYRDLIIFERVAGRIDSLHYLLVDSGVAAPTGRPGLPIITTPVKSLALLSSVDAAMAEFVGVAGRIDGLGSTRYVYSPAIRSRVRSGEIRQVGIDAGINNELIISMHPGVVIAMSDPDAAGGAYKTLKDAGIPVLPDADWLETTPLGRAEWVKVIGALTDREDYAGRKFDTMAQAYLRLAAIGRSAATRPSVILEMPFKGTWYVPAGGSFVAQMLRDAGAGYHWTDTKGSGSLPLSFESVASVALKADFWLDIGDVNSKKDILAVDQRFGAFRAFRTGALYNYNKRVNDLGSDDYWESGVVNPQLVLGDLIRILHPGLLPADTLVYYKQLK